MNDDQAFTYLRWAVVAIVAGAGGWMLLRPGTSPEPVPASRYAGCYRSGATLVRLTGDGQLITSDGTWRFRVAPAVAGKHRDLIWVEGINPVGTAAATRFEKSRLGNSWEVDASGGFRIAASDALFQPQACPPEAGA